MPRFLKATIWAGGLVMVVVSVCLVALVKNWGESSASVEQDTLICEKSSLDGQFVAEVRTFLTAMHGGPDRLYVVVKPAHPIPPPWEDRIYTRTYECSDATAFKLDWLASTKLVVTYGACGSNPAHMDDENRIWEQSSESHGITIVYQDSGVIAKR